MADHFLSSIHQKMRDCHPLHPCIHPCIHPSVADETTGATSVSTKGTASLNVRALKKSCAEKQEPPHLITQKLFLSLPLV